MIRYWVSTLASAGLTLAACSDGAATPPEKTGQSAGISQDSVATEQAENLVSDTQLSGGLSPKTISDTSTLQNSDDIFYCETQLNGRHYFYLDPKNAEKAIVGFEFTKAYQDAYPDDVAPIGEMTSAITGSGMRYINSAMEFRAKGKSGYLTLADGTTVQCDQQTREMPDEDLIDPPGGGLSFEWSANGFETLSDDFKWEGNGGNNPGVSLAIPETDNFVWISQCDSGKVKTHFLLAPESLELGDETTLQFETDKTPLRTYPIEVGPLPFGDGAHAGAMSPVLVQSIDDPMFTDLTMGEWGYFQVGEGDNAAKLRVNLWGSISAWNGFIPACRNLSDGRIEDTGKASADTTITFTSSDPEVRFNSLSHPGGDIDVAGLLTNTVKFVVDVDNHGLECRPQGINAFMSNGAVVEFAGDVCESDMQIIDTSWPVYDAVNTEPASDKLEFITGKMTQDQGFEFDGHYLAYTIPETDGTVFNATCQSGKGSINTEFYSGSRLPGREAVSVPVNIVAGSNVYKFMPEMQERQLEDSLLIPVVETRADDMFWISLMREKEMDLIVGNSTPIRIPLTDAKAEVKLFVEGCRE